MKIQYLKLYIFSFASYNKILLRYYEVSQKLNDFFFKPCVLLAMECREKCGAVKWQMVVTGVSNPEDGRVL